MAVTFAGNLLTLVDDALIVGDKAFTAKVGDSRHTGRLYVSQLQGLNQSDLGQLDRELVEAVDSAARFELCIRRS